MVLTCHRARSHALARKSTQAGAVKVVGKIVMYTLSLHNAHTLSTQCINTLDTMHTHSRHNAYTLLKQCMWPSTKVPGLTVRDGDFVPGDSYGGSVFGHGPELMQHFFNHLQSKTNTASVHHPPKIIIMWVTISVYGILGLAVSLYAKCTFSTHPYCPNQPKSSSHCPNQPKSSSYCPNQPKSSSHSPNQPNHHHIVLINQIIITLS